MRSAIPIHHACGLDAGQEVRSGSGGAHQYLAKEGR